MGTIYVGKRVSAGARAARLVLAGTSAAADITGCLCMFGVMILFLV